MPDDDVSHISPTIGKALGSWHSRAEDVRGYQKQSLALRPYIQPHQQNRWYQPVIVSILI